MKYIFSRGSSFYFTLCMAALGLLCLPSCFGKNADNLVKENAPTVAEQPEAPESETQPANPESETQPADSADEASQKADEPAEAESPKEEAQPAPEETKPAPEEAKPAQQVKADPQQVQDAIQKAAALREQNQYDEALRLLYETELKSGPSDELWAAYDETIKNHPNLNAEPIKMTIGEDLTGLKRIGGGSSLVYKFYKDGETIAAYKPFQKRYQSNYRSEIAAYKLCPKMKCGFNIPINLPVYFDYNDFSKIYSRNPANLKSEFEEIIPTRLPDGTTRIDGTRKEWIKDFAEYPIEFSNIWQPWLNPGTARDDLQKPASDLIPIIAKRHKRGEKYAQRLAPHLENLSQYDLARQISNLLVFDYLINNWDRFSGSPTLYGVNCQFANGRFMSIDNGAGFSQTPHEKPNKWFHSISRFSKTTYLAIKNFDENEMRDYLFPNATEFEQDKFKTFWNLRQKYLDYVQECIDKNGEAETFFFE
ncbi:MAG: hypothetical protein J6A01_09250 [Proteobacteria bacterium]|nr:hypothetical protein [Pseudomonadota bacterium]